MLITVTGGSGSGKSEYAENLAVSMNRGNLVYIATMIPCGEEGRMRVERHRAMRAEKNFQTIECYTNLKEVPLSGRATVLLECMSNLAANEIFEENGAKEQAAEDIIEGLEHLKRTCDHVIVVTNEIFSDGMEYDRDMILYLKTLGKINCWLAAHSEKAVEVVYSIPVVLKGNFGGDLR
ncbi:MAG: bifunctional adenosylcobinamide kinase/adenosylcobinamide-phosphate guanylyltransferase [Lachnospiraceae bacterium]